MRNSNFEKQPRYQVEKKFSRQLRAKTIPNQEQVSRFIAEGNPNVQPVSPVNGEPAEPAS